MYLIKGNNINIIQIELLKLLKDKGDIIDVRNLRTLEVYPVIIHLTNIRNRCTTLFKRNWNFIFAIGELGWHMNGSNELDHINYYSKNWNDISEDRKHISESCYGAKIFKQTKDWDNLVKELKSDLHSRRAVINLYASDNTLAKNKKDVACTVSLQFLLRKGKLDQIVTMRSNDIIWGLPNDVFFFTMLQEYLSNLLGVEVGEYYHQVASMHIYEWHFKLLDEIISEPKYFDFSMPKMVDINELESFLKSEKNIRKNINEDVKISSKYWQDFVEVLKLRTPSMADNEKERIVENSVYKEIIKLCPTSYIKHWGLSG